MNKLPNGVIVKDEREYAVYKIYDFRCVLHPERFALTLHHDPPRSLNPHYQDMPHTWWPLCGECHDLAHNLPRGEMTKRMQRSRSIFFPGVEELLNALSSV